MVHPTTTLSFTGHLQRGKWRLDGGGNILTNVVIQLVKHYCFYMLNVLMTLQLETLNQPTYILKYRPVILNCEFCPKLPGFSFLWLALQKECVLLALLRSYRTFTKKESERIPAFQRYSNI